LAYFFSYNKKQLKLIKWNTDNWGTLV
jgi:hypothetical protein